MRASRLAVAAVLAAVAVTWCKDPPARRAVRVATFNIEYFPQHEAQVDGAFALIASLDADVIALQEITDPARLAAEARARLGESWRFVSSADLPGAARHPRLHTGVLYDDRAWRLAGAELHRDTTVDGVGIPVLDVRLEPRAGGAALRVLVVHLKAGSEGRPLRARQHARLAALVERLRRGPDRVVVAGDFNATDEADRVDLAALARVGDLTWASEPLACTAFWRRDGDCATSRLDHVLTWAPARDVRARGACETDGCATRDRCPAYRDRISDHCPVVVTVP